VDKDKDSMGDIREHIDLRVNRAIKHGVEIACCTASALATAVLMEGLHAMDKIAKVAIDELLVPPAKQLCNTGQAEPNLVQLPWRAHAQTAPPAASGACTQTL
jgi:hypothetical protein